MPFIALFGIIPSFVAYAFFIEDFCAGPAPNAPPESSRVARVLRCFYHRRTWEFFVGLHILTTISDAFVALDVGDWWPMWYPSLAINTVVHYLIAVLMTGVEGRWAKKQPGEEYTLEKSACVTDSSPV